MPGQRDSLTDVAGLRVGHWTDREAWTGCTVVLCDPGVVGGVDVRGAAPGTRETDLLLPTRRVEHVDAVVLTGGSAFGLAAAHGVVEYLAERGRGHPTGAGPVPIVPAAVLFDLGMSEVRRPPDATAGRRACEAAGFEVEQGSVGAGTGATVAKLGGIPYGLKGGVGTASMELATGVTVGALVAVNATGDIYDPDGAPLARSRRDGGTRSALDYLAAGEQPAAVASGANTTIGVVATDAALTKEQAVKLAQLGHDGYARAIRPAHTMVDGDVLFALATGRRPGPVDLWQFTAIGAVAVEVIARAIANAVRRASGHPRFPAVEAA